MLTLLFKATMELCWLAFAGLTAVSLGSGVSQMLMAVFG